MLKNLRIKNFVLIKEVELEFSPGLNLFTGETGAGKSLLISAVEIMIGGKNRSDLIRRGADKAVLEGEFILHDKDTIDRLERLDVDFVPPHLIVRREINKNGRTRNFLNDSPVTVKQLSELGAKLMDLCGQHEHQTLLQKEFHLDYLDRFAGLMEKRDEISNLYSEHKKLTSQLARLITQREKSESVKDLKEFEIAEIEKIAPSIDQENQLINEEKTLRHAEQILEFCTAAEESLNDMQGSAIDIVGGVSDEIGKIAQYSDELRKASEDIDSANTLLTEAYRCILNLRVNFDYSQERLEEIRSRLGEFSRLKRKYGGSTEAVLEYLQKLKSDSESFSHLDTGIEQLSRKIDGIHKSLEEKAGELSNLRESAVPDLVKTVVAGMKDLGFDYIDFQLMMDRISGGDIEYNGGKFGLNHRGIDDCEMYISTNAGEPPLPIKDIASGGEISRILLALKSVIAGKDKTGTLVFDEIDKGISGRIARKVGLKLFNTGRDQQIFAITHLPQIASLPGKHFCVIKSSENEHAVTNIVELNENDRVKELAKILSTGESSKHGEEYARDLLSGGAKANLFD